MKRKIKMLLYGEPGVGKSTFAHNAPKRFFITTDGNYEWLDEFGAKAEDHKQVSSWKEFIDFVSDDSNLKDYETLVIDLLEDLFNWNEHEFVKRNKLEHIGDMGYGKGYGITRDEFFIEISKVIAKPMHIIGIMHESKEVVKDRRGVETTIYRPHRDLPEAVLGKIEGRMRFVVRAYMQDVEQDGTIEMRRMLSVSPKPNEYGIMRGVKDEFIQDDIPLDWNEFEKLIDSARMTKDDIKPEKKKKVEPKKIDTAKVEEIQEEKAEEKEKLDDKKAELAAKLAAARAARDKSEKVEEETIEEAEEDLRDNEEVVEETETFDLSEKPKEEKVEEDEKIEEESVEEDSEGTESKDDKFLNIRAKLKAVKLGAKPNQLEKAIEYIIKNQRASDEDITKFIKTIK